MATTTSSSGSRWSKWAVLALAVGALMGSTGCLPGMGCGGAKDGCIDENGEPVPCNEMPEVDAGPQQDAGSVSATDGGIIT